MRKSLASSALLAGALTLTFVSNTASAQVDSFINLGTFDGAQVFVASGSNAARVGNGVLLSVHEVYPNWAVSTQRLVACDGSWASGQLRFWASAVTKPIDLEQNFLSIVSSVPLESVGFSEWRKSDLPFGAALKSNLKSLCRNASKEPQNLLIPIASYPPSETKPGATIAIMTGTMITRGGLIEGWTQAAHFKLKPMMLNGSPVEANGVVRQERVATGTSTKNRNGFNCQTRETGLYQFLDYSEDGRVVEEGMLPRNKVEFSTVVPDSVGEARLEAVCRIYGKK